LARSRTAFRRGDCYVGLRAGLTVSASIPISVLSISILRAFGRSTILETTSSRPPAQPANRSPPALMFTIPALIFLGFGSEFHILANLSAGSRGGGSACSSWCAARQLHRQGTRKTDIFRRHSLR